MAYWERILHSDAERGGSHFEKIAKIGIFSQNTTNFGPKNAPNSQNTQSPQKSQP